MKRKLRKLPVYAINHYGEGKAAVRARLQAADPKLWNIFIQMRTGYVQEGYTMDQAWRLCASKEEFFPPKGTRKYSKKLAVDFKPGLARIDDNQLLKDRKELEKNADVWKGKRTANMREVVLWVFDNLAVSDVKPEEAPSPGAWWLLKRAKSSGTMAERIIGMVEKLMPTRTEINQRMQFEDDEHSIERMLKKVEEVSQGISEGDRNDRFNRN